MKKSLPLLALAASLVLAVPVTEATAAPFERDDSPQLAMLSSSILPSVAPAAISLPAPMVLAQAPAEVSSARSFDWQGMLSEAVLAVIGALALAFWRRQNLTEERRKLILTFGDMAYGVVNEVARRSANTIDDKAALGLRYVLDLLAANGQKPLNPGEQATVKALFEANHGNEAKRLEAVAAAAPKVVNIGTQPAPQSP